MSNPPVNPANGYGAIIGNGHQTVNLASAVLELIHRPLTTFWTRRNARAALRKGLGEWAEEAFDTNDQCQQPILREDPFVTHLIDNKAAFHPSGTCYATFAWAKLLYALDIRPGNNIIEWRPLGTDADPDKSGTLELALEGPVLCHIVNLYRIYETPYSVRPSYFEAKSRAALTLQFPFGALTIHLEHYGSGGNSAVEVTSEPGSWTATFKPHSNTELSARRQPFVTAQQNGLDWSGGPLGFEPNSVAIKYVSTVKHAMCSDGLLRLPDPKDTIQTRCLSLCKCLATLTPPPGVSLNSASGSTLDMHNSMFPKPYLVTPSWIEQASRIKRRATTDGGTDKGLVDLLVQSLLEKPIVVGKIKEILGRDDETWQQTVRGVVRSDLFYKHDRFQFWWDEGARSYNYLDHVRTIAMEELPDALEFLAQSSPRTWLRSLSEMIPEVITILRYRTIENYPVLVLQLTSDHPLWKSTFYVQGQVPTR
ncbi:hypothetical protein F5Y01DRAFT_193419 [Xylaria sp. FL0043]|nr:hypothetical protein F5Y01DRAFT_193419 [Xylaria sp. FL0043]